MSNSDRRLTPEWLLAVVREFFGGRIPLDAYTEANNPTGARAFCCLEDPPAHIAGPAGVRHACDGNAVSWHTFDGTWAQPPFSIMGPCVDKAVAEARLGAEILFLSRSDSRTKWYHRLAENCDARCNIARSVGFIEVLEDGSLKNLGGDFHPYTIWYFGRQRRRFARVFSQPRALGKRGKLSRMFAPFGEVIPGMGPAEVSEAAQ